MEPVDTFRNVFLKFQLEDELFVEGGRDVMVGVAYVPRAVSEERRERCYGRRSISVAHRRLDLVLDTGMHG